MHFDRLVVAASFFGLCLAGCGSESAGEPDEQDLTAAPTAAEAEACQEGSVGKDANGSAVVRCTTPFPTAPMIRLPDDKLSSATVKFYAGVSVPIDFSGQFVLWARDGQRYLPVDASGEPIQFSDGKHLPKALHAPTNRITFTIYQFAGKLGDEVTSPYGPAKAIRLSSARPVVEIDGCAFDTRLLGTWDGSVSERLAKPEGSGPFAKSFDESKRLPIDVTLASASAGTALSEYKGGPALKDADTFKLSGTIDNFDEAKTIDGKKYPSLQAMGTKNPFQGAKDGKIELYRLGNMHGQMNDGHWVLTYPAGSQSLSGNGMSFTLTSFTAPAFLFDEDVHEEAIDQIEIRPHIPFVSNGHSVILAPVAIGEHMGECPN